MNNKKILIIGGMGPQASLALHTKIIDKATEMGARDGCDFPAITHVSVPVKDFIDTEQEAKKALSVIKECLYRLWPISVHAHSNRVQHSAYVH